MVDNCFPRRQLGNCSVTRPSLCEEYGLRDDFDHLIFNCSKVKLQPCIFDGWFSQFRGYFGPLIASLSERTLTAWSNFDPGCRRFYMERISDYTLYTPLRACTFPNYANTHTNMQRHNSSNLSSCRLWTGGRGAILKRYNLLWLSYLVVIKSPSLPETWETVPVF